MASVWFLASATCAFTISSDTAAPLSIMPLISQLQHKHGGELETHSQVYGRRRMNEGLTSDNTAPIRLHLDFNSLYEETAPQYTACFEEGAWFRQGLPTDSEPPADGIETCDRGPDSWRTSTSSCWGKCTEADLITTQKRYMVERLVTEVAAEMSELVALRPLEAPLTFTVSKGRYEQALRANGFTPVEACAADCQVLSGVAVDSAYCADGVGADAVVSITKPPVVPGVRGTGSQCAIDQQGRPIWLVFAWVETLDALGSDYEANLASTRGLILHELIHALGFSNAMFNNARDSLGARKGLLKLQRVTDVDGAVDQVWHFVKGRAYTLAQDYFDCADQDAWLGLPLMGEPELGRGSHWETRIMRDDVMSYGFRSAVSALTLAALEDLGFYVGNYSAASCIHWGYRQGCEFVTSRCGVGRDDRSANTSSSDLCEGDPVWATQSLPLLESKCYEGSDPCTSLVSSGFQVSSTGSKVCNAQCYTGPHGSCQRVVSQGVEDAGTVSHGASADAWTSWLWLAVWGLAFLVFVSCVRMFFCPPAGSVTITITTVSVLLVGGICLVAFALYALFLEYDLFASYVGKTSLYASLACGVALIVFGALTILGVTKRSRSLVLVLIGFGTLLLLLEIATSVLLLYWVWSVDSTGGQEINVEGSSGGRWEGKLGEEFLAEVESVACRTYQLCCRDPALDEIGDGSGSGEASATSSTCYSLPEGPQVDIATVAQDPSSEKFCKYVSGSSSSIDVAVGLCSALDRWVADFTQGQCQQDFCVLGTDGYVVFVDTMVEWVKVNAIAIGAVCTVLVLVQLVLLVNMWNLQENYKSHARKQVRDTPREVAAPVLRPSEAGIHGVEA